MLSRTQTKLQKMAEEFPFQESHRTSAHVDDSDYFYLSDGEPEATTNGVSAQGMQLPWRFQRGSLCKSLS